MGILSLKQGQRALPPVVDSTFSYFNDSGDDFTELGLISGGYTPSSFTSPLTFTVNVPTANTTADQILLCFYTSP
jgi:hypothetical protein